jgi:transposase
MKKNGIKLRDINTTKIKEVKHFNKDKEEQLSSLKYLSSQQKQAIVTRMISNEKTITSLVKNKFQKLGQLQFKSELNYIPLKQYGNSYVFKSFNKVRISGISGQILLRTGNQLQIADELANANLIKKPDGYYLKVTAYINKENFKEKPSNGKDIGLDFGIKTNITTSEGEKMDISIEESERLKKL